MKVLLLVAITIASTIAAPVSSGTQVQRASTRFASKLYSELNAGNDNVLFAPYNLHTGLSLLYIGAASSSKVAMQDVLLLPDQADTVQQYGKLNEAIRNVVNVTLKTANKVYILANYQFTQQFEEAAKNGFKAEFESIDFKNNQESAKTINEWVGKQTDNKITDLIDASKLSTTTRLVLVNAIYFKGQWAHRFDAAKTRRASFLVEGKTEREVDMMSQVVALQYKNAADLDAKIVVLPYNNKETSMVVILPNKNDGLDELERKLADVDPLTLVENAETKVVNVTLPKMRIEEKLELEEPLKALGLGIIFDQTRANFTNLVRDSPDLYVTDVQHNAYLEINEEGAEASAATQIIVNSKLTPASAVNFTANHPFIFFIQHKIEKSAVLLFYGRVNDPTEN